MAIPPLDARLGALLAADDDKALAAIELGTASLAERRAARELLRLLNQAVAGEAAAWQRLSSLDLGAPDPESELVTLRPPGPSLTALRPEALANAGVAVDGLHISLAEYAALSAACGALPRRRRETHAKFGIADDAMRGRLDDAWEQRFVAEPELRQLWELLARRFRSWLIQYGSV